MAQPPGGVIGDLVSTDPFFLEPTKTDTTPQQQQQQQQRQQVQKATAAVKPPETWTDWAVNALPWIGGGIGGLAGAGWASVPLAALGAAGGEAWKENINRYRGAGAAPFLGAVNQATGGQVGAPSPTMGPGPSTPADAVQAMSWEAAKNAALQAGGNVLAGGLKGVAPTLMRYALGRSEATLASNPDIAKIMLNKGWWLNRGSMKELDDLLASPASNFAKPQLKAVREAMAEAWKSAGQKGATQGSTLALLMKYARSPAFNSLMAHGFYNGAAFISGLTPAAIRLAVLGEGAMEGPMQPTTQTAGAGQGQ